MVERENGGYGGEALERDKAGRAFIYMFFFWWISVMELCILGQSAKGAYSLF